MFLYRGIRKLNNFRKCDPITVDEWQMQNCALLRSYDTFRNLSLIFLKFCIRKEHSTVIFKTTLNHGVIDLVFFSQIFEKLMHFMSQTSLSSKLVSFFARFIPSDILTLPEILFCLVEIIFLLLYRNYWAKSRNSRNKFLTQNWYKSELPSLIFTNFCLHYLHDALNKKT